MVLSVQPDEALNEMRVKAVAAMEAVYRLSGANGFDPALRFSLRARSADVLALAAGLAFRPNIRRKSSAEDLAASAMAARELISFAEKRGWIGSQQASMVGAAYRRIADRAMESSAIGPQEEESVRLDDINSRQREILRHLAEKKCADLGALRAIFGQGYSEKTLQRDLLGLVEAGHIRKRGDNRWTKYFPLGHRMS